MESCYLGLNLLTEVPEMFGAETILMNRCANKELFEKTVHLINDFKEPRFHNQIPVNDEPDHGIGVRSIISVIEKYNGIYAFFTKDGTFYFQACI